MQANILIVEDDLTVSQSLRGILESKGAAVRDADTAKQALQAVSSTAKFAPDVILLDVQLPDNDDLTLLKALHEKIPQAVVIIMTGHGSVPQSVEAMKLGASDYIMKPFNIDELIMRIERSLDNQDLKEQVSYLHDQVYGEVEDACVQGPNPVMKKIYDSLGLIAKSNSSTVLIHGETGTGKEVIARRIHSLSHRSKKPFVEVNATALTEELLESELFGHEEGAFTGALKSKKGLFEVATGGTLFLDEIGDMNLVMQAKILRALQERKIRRVGGTDHIDVDIRLITATNKNLEEEVNKGNFREDLYYRLNVVPINLPPLRDRKDDIETLVRYFIQCFNKELGRKIEDVHPEALEMLVNDPWPGNVRQLKNLLERTILLECDETTLRPAHLKLGSKTIGVSTQAATPASTGGLIGQKVPLEQVEREHIEGVLRSTSGNKNQAAMILGIDRTTLYNKLKKYEVR